MEDETGSLTWTKLGVVCLVCGLLLATAAAFSAANSTFFLIDASACIALALAFFVVALRANAPQPQLPNRGARTGWGVNLLLVMVVLSASSPLVKTGLETAAQGSVATPPVPPIINKVTCPLTVPNGKTCKHGECAGRHR